MFFTHLQDQLQYLETEGLLRYRRTVEGSQDTHVKVDGRDFISFCSNDYLGLASHPLLVAAACEGAELYGVGAGASHLVSGHNMAHHLVEKNLQSLSNCRRPCCFPPVIWQTSEW